MTLLPCLAIAEEDSFWGFEDARDAWQGVIWKTSMADYSAASYAGRVGALLKAFEEATGRGLVPGRHGRVALKIYSNSGAGLHTPKPVVDALIAELLGRGFTMEGICIVDARDDMLRDAGFLPALSRIELEGPYYRGVRVYALNNGSLKSPTWYYESPLPREFTSPLGREILRPVVQLDPVEARKSYLPSILFGEVDFWINLPMANHHPSTGVSGALVNASLWNITNGTRFLNSPANAPVAVAEIAAIPELKAGWALNLLCLEQYQYIGGPAYNSQYTAGLPQLWMSVDPVIMDANLVGLVNSAREASGFESLAEVPEFIVFSMQLGLGRGIASETRFLEVP